jgi:hypothetical protein
MHTRTSASLSIRPFLKQQQGESENSTRLELASRNRLPEKIPVVDSFLKTKETYLIIQTQMWMK